MFRQLFLFQFFEAPHDLFYLEKSEHSLIEMVCLVVVLECWLELVPKDNNNNNKNKNNNNKFRKFLFEKKKLTRPKKVQVNIVFSISNFILLSSENFIFESNVVVNELTLKEKNIPKIFCHRLSIYICCSTFFLHHFCLRTLMVQYNSWGVVLASFEMFFVNKVDSFLRPWF